MITLQNVVFTNDVRTHNNIILILSYIKIINISVNGSLAWTPFRVCRLRGPKAESNCQKEPYLSLNHPTRKYYCCLKHVAIRF